MLPAWGTFFIPDHFKTQEMCDKAVEEALSMQIQKNGKGIK